MLAAQQKLYLGKINPAPAQQIILVEEPCITFNLPASVNNDAVNCYHGDNLSCCAANSARTETSVWQVS